MVISGDGHSSRGGEHRSGAGAAHLAGAAAQDHHRRYVQTHPAASGNVLKYNIQSSNAAVSTVNCHRELIFKY